MENLMYTTIEVLSIEEIKSVLMRNEASRLSIKISMNKHQLTTLILNSFDGMTDCVEYDRNATFSKVDSTKIDFEKRCFGIDGFWTVGSSRDYIKPISENGFTGFEVYNCCGTSLIAIKN